MIKETPLFGKVDAQVLNASEEWHSVTPDATGVTIHRGGIRDGLAVRTDVGLCTFTLHNAEDPMDGGSLKPGQDVKVLAGEVIEHPEEVIYSEGFESGVGGWATGWSYGYSTPTSSATQKRSGSSSLLVSSTNAEGKEDVWVDLPWSELVVGRDYTFEAWVYLVAGSSIKLHTGSRSRPDVPSTTLKNQWVRLSVTRTFHTAEDGLILHCEGTPSELVEFYLDDVSITQSAYTEDLRVPIFTGKIANLNSVYPINKDTGESRAKVEVTVADAVQIHTTTPRYGVTIPDPYFETFEERIDRLDGSARAELDVPEIGAPREVYAF